ncbi:MAG: hypothetical protein R2743_26165 [Ilumatobacteraceae bacterium]
MEVHFRRGALATSVERLGTDDEFRARHRMLAVVGRVLVAARVTALLRRLPESWSTPIDFALSADEDGARAAQRWLTS